MKLPKCFDRLVRCKPSSEAELAAHLSRMQELEARLCSVKQKLRSGEITKELLQQWDALMTLYTEERLV